MFKELTEGCMPTRATKYSACVDVYANEDVTIGAGETKVIKLGVKLDLDFNTINPNYNSYTDEMKKDYVDNFMKSHYLEVALRSSLAVKGLIIANGIGIIDLDYPDEIGLIVHNPVTQIKNFQGGYCEIYPDTFYVNKGDKVAQCTLKEHKGYLMGYESDTIRVGGYGSTGEK